MVYESNACFKQFNCRMYVQLTEKKTNNIENGNGECVKEKTTRPQKKQQQKVTNKSIYNEVIYRKTGNTFFS